MLARSASKWASRPPRSAVAPAAGIVGAPARGLLRYAAPHRHAFSSARANGRQDVLSEDSRTPPPSDPNQLPHVLRPAGVTERPRDLFLALERNAERGRLGSVMSISSKIKAHFDEAIETRKAILERGDELDAEDRRAFEGQTTEADVGVYNALLKAFSLHGMVQEALGVLTDMDRARVRADLESFNHLVKAAVMAGDDVSLAGILARMSSEHVPRNAITYAHLIRHYRYKGNLEGALQTLTRMSEDGLKPTADAEGDVLEIAAEYREARLIFDLAEEFEGQGLRKLTPKMWMTVLRCCADRHHVEGVEKAWEQAVTGYRVVPEEGLCIAVLNVAARAGKPALATRVIGVLQSQGVKFQEHHFAPLLEAYCRAGQLREGMQVLSTMRELGTKPVSETADALYKAISTDLETLDESFYMLEGLHQKGIKVDVTALNTVIKASVALVDLHRALATYKECENLNVRPNVDTFNLLLSGCVQAGQRPLGDRLLAEMGDAGVEANAGTYEQMVLLCLTQSTYEDAFTFLENIKHKGVVPSQGVYEAIIRKCAVNKDERWEQAVEEMERAGYKVSRELGDFVHRTTGVRGSWRADRRREEKGEVRVDGGKDKFREKGRDKFREKGKDKFRDKGKEEGKGESDAPSSSSEAAR